MTTAALIIAIPILVSAFYAVWATVAPSVLKGAL